MRQEVGRAWKQGRRKIAQRRATVLVRGRLAMKTLLRLLTAILAFGLTITFAHAEKRLALVIGNGLYPNLPADQQLEKAVSDANAVGDALETIGFEVVRGENLSRSEMTANLAKVSGRLGHGDTVFFFYAGHGMTSQGENYLLPSSVPAAMTSLMAEEAISQAQILSDLTASGAELTILVVDACRKNPFAGSGGGDLGDYACDPSRPAETSTGVFTLYSASMGQEALDRLSAEDSHPNSVFVRRLAPALKRQGRELVAIAREVGGGVVVLAQSGGLAEMAREVEEEVTALAQGAGHTQRPAYQDQATTGQVHQTSKPAAPDTRATHVRATHVGGSEPAAPTPDVEKPAPRTAFAPVVEKSEPESRPPHTGPARQIGLVPLALVPPLLALPYFERSEPERRVSRLRRVPRVILAPHVRRSEAEIRRSSGRVQLLASLSSEREPPAASPAKKRKAAVRSGQKRKIAAHSARKGRGTASSVRKRNPGTPSGRSGRPAAPSKGKRKRDR